MSTTRARGGTVRLLLLAGVAGLLAACGGNGEPMSASTTRAASASVVRPSAAPSQPPAETSPAARPDGRVVEVAIAAGQVETAADQVELAAGDAVRLVVTSDVDDELHVHGAEQEAELLAGEPATLDVVFDEPGVYDVETHETGLLLIQFVVR